MVSAISACMSVLVALDAATASSAEPIQGRDLQTDLANAVAEPERSASPATSFRHNWQAVLDSLHPDAKSGEDAAEVIRQSQLSRERMNDRKFDHSQGAFSTAQASVFMQDSAGVNNKQVRRGALKPPRPNLQHPGSFVAYLRIDPPAKSLKTKTDSISRRKSVVRESSDRLKVAATGSEPGNTLAAEPLAFNAAAQTRDALALNATISPPP